jgi:competence protein ComEC
MALAAVVAALVLRRPPVLIVGAALLASALGARAHAGLSPPAAPVAVAAEVTLLTDPADAFGAVRADVRVGRRHVEAWARGAAAGALRDRLAGERVLVRGRLRAPPPDAIARLARRHVSARLTVEEVLGWRAGDPASRLANGLRRTLELGAAPLGDERRALFTGMVYGDDRDQPPEVADDFRGAGLTHLLAVSGQNVAFVLVLAGPGLRRLRLGPRWAVTLVLLAFFALATRFEPSVLRAVTMAAIATTAAGLGRSVGRGRILALAVAGVLLIDPLLVRSVGFLLSVGATTGIVVLAAPIATRVPGPRLLADALGVTLAAQIGVAPVLVPVFDGIPVASVPANLLAVPAAGPLMAWGLTGGLLAGLVGPPLDGVLHAPTGLLLAWVAGVARWAASLPLGVVDGRHLIAIGAVLATALALRRWRRVAVALAAALVVVPAVSPASALDGDELALGARVWRRGGAVVVVLDDADPARVLEGLRRRAVDRVDLLVLARGNRTVAGTVLVLRRRVRIGTVLAPPGHSVRDADTAAPRQVLTVGPLRVEVRATGPPLEVAVRGP